MKLEEFQAAKQKAIDAVSTGGPLSREPFEDEVTEFYLQQSRKDRGGGYAAAYALMRIMELLRGDAAEGDTGLTPAVQRIAAVLERREDSEN